MNYEDMDDAQLVVKLGDAREDLAMLSDVVGRLEQEAIKRIVANEGRELYHPKWECKLTPPTPTYNMPKLYAALGENVDPDIWKDAWVKEKPKVGIELAHFNLVKLNPIARAHGKKITDPMDAARLPSAPGKLKVTRRE